MWFKHIYFVTKEWVRQKCYMNPVYKLYRFFGEYRRKFHSGWALQKLLNYKVKWHLIYFYIYYWSLQIYVGYIPFKNHATCTGFQSTPLPSHLTEYAVHFQCHDESFHFLLALRACRLQRQHNQIISRWFVLFRPRFCSVRLYWTRDNLANEMSFVMPHAPSVSFLGHDSAL